jgi:hypothetical protein
LKREISQKIIFEKGDKTKDFFEKGDKPKDCL